MAEPWCPDEVAWARECFHAGDSFEEIAQAASRTVQDVASVLGSGRSITPRQREILSLYTAGCSFEAIARELGMTGGREPKKVPANAITILRRKGIPIPHRIRPTCRRSSPQTQEVTHA